MRELEENLLISFLPDVSACHCWFAHVRHSKPMSPLTDVKRSGKKTPERLKTGSRKGNLQPKPPFPVSFRPVASPSVDHQVEELRPLANALA